MIAITKSMIAASALMSAGLVTAYDMTGSFRAEAPATVVAERFPSKSEMLTTVALAPGETVSVAARKGDRLPIVKDA